MTKMLIVKIPGIIWKGKKIKFNILNSHLKKLEKLKLNQREKIKAEINKLKTEKETNDYLKR